MEEATYDLAAGGAAKEEGGLGVLVDLGGTLLERPLGTGCPRLAVRGEDCQLSFGMFHCHNRLTYTWRSILAVWLCDDSSRWIG